MEKQDLGDTRIPVLLITDIGGDIDDTLAVIAFNGLKEKVNLVGIVTSGGDCVARAVQAKLWQQHLGVPDDKCKVIVGPDPEYLRVGEYKVGSGYGISSNIDGQTNSEEQVQSLNLEYNSTEAILKIVDEHKENLIIMGIGPLTPLGEAIKEDHSDSISKVKGIYLQGRLETDTDGQIMPWHINAYNFDQDKPASELVFKKLRDKVPFTLCGGPAAKQLTLTYDDYHEFHREGMPQIEGIMWSNAEKEYKKNAQEFYAKYEHPVEYQTEERWKDFMDFRAIAHPYDPMLLLALVNPELFDLLPVKNPHNEIVHRTIGNHHYQHGVKNPE